RSDLLLELAPFLVEGVGRQRGLLALLRIALLPQRLLLERDLFGILGAFLLDLLTHHLRGFRILQQRLNVHYDDRQGWLPCRGCGRRALLCPSSADSATKPGQEKD